MRSLYNIKTDTDFTENKPRGEEATQAAKANKSRTRKFQENCSWCCKIETWSREKPTSSSLLCFSLCLCCSLRGLHFCPKCVRFSAEQAILCSSTWVCYNVTPFWHHLPRDSISPTDWGFSPTRLSAPSSPPHCTWYTSCKPGLSPVLLTDCL